MLSFKTLILTVCVARVRQLVSTVSVPLPLPAKAAVQEGHTYVILPLYYQGPDAIFSPVSSSKEVKVAQSPRVTSSSSSTPIPSSTTDNRNAASAAASAASPSVEPQKPKHVMDSTTAPLQGASQRVKRKRKTLDDLIDVDQKKFRMSTPSTQPNVGSSSLNEVCQYILEALTQSTLLPPRKLPNGPQMQLRIQQVISGHRSMLARMLLLRYHQSRRKRQLFLAQMSLGNRLWIRQL